MKDLRQECIDRIVIKSGLTNGNSIVLDDIVAVDNNVDTYVVSISIPETGGISFNTVDREPSTEDSNTDLHYEECDEYEYGFIDGRDISLETLAIIANLIEANDFTQL